MVFMRLTKVDAAVSDSGIPNKSVQTAVLYM